MRKLLIAIAIILPSLAVATPGPSSIGFWHSAVVGYAGSPSPVITQLQNLGMQVLRYDPVLKFVQVLARDNGSLNGATAISGVRYAEWDSLGSTYSVPNDPLFAQQWSLGHIQVPTAWDIVIPRRPVTIAVLDTGIDATHEDFQGVLEAGTGWPYGDANALVNITPYLTDPGLRANWTVPGLQDVQSSVQFLRQFAAWVQACSQTINCGDPPEPGDSPGLTPAYEVFHAYLSLTDEAAIVAPVGVTDDMGHGTFTSGLAAARVDNAKGIAGVCRTCHLLPVKVLNAAGGGLASNMASGLRWAVDNGADIASISAGFPEGSIPLREAIDYAEAQDVVVVAASGNRGTNAPSYPAAYPTVIAVGGSNKNDLKWYLSQYGRVSVVAPAEEIVSTVPMASDPRPEWGLDDFLRQVGTPRPQWVENILERQMWNTLVDGYSTASGTSASAPLVAGAVGLALTCTSEWTYVWPRSWRAMVNGTAQDVAPAGFDPQTGYGLVRADLLATQACTTVDINLVWGVRE